MKSFWVLNCWLDNLNTSLWALRNCDDHVFDILLTNQLKMNIICRLELLHPQSNNIFTFNPVYEDVRDLLLAEVSPFL